MPHQPQKRFTAATVGSEFIVTFTSKKRSGVVMTEAYDRNGMIVCWSLILRSHPDATFVAIA